MKQITITIDGKKYPAKTGESILQVAIRNNLDIPHFCYHEDLPIDANCRTCLVETENKKVVTSCTLKAQEGLKVLTNTARVKKLRHENMELLLAEHKKYCPKCQNRYRCSTAEKMKKYKVTGEKYKRDKVKDPIHKMGMAAEFDPKLCIDCNKCVEICDKIGIGFLKLKGNDSKTRISYNEDPCVDCIYCGQCTVHCPVAAIREQFHLEQVEKALKDKDKIVIAQMSPSTRASIGEEFGQPPGTNLMGEMYTALRKIGFDKIFDINMGADITTYTEAMDLADRIKNHGALPVFSSCCPAWVKYAEFFHPEILPHLTKARSPQSHSGGAYKTWWAEKVGIDPKKIVVVSFVPCTSKKYEARLKKLKINGMYPVDYVLTTRETADLLRKHKIDLLKLKPGKVDKYGTFSGAGAIYGASGGVMESVLRSACYFLTGKEFKKVEFKRVRGMEGIKKATVKMGNVTLKVAVVAMAKNAHTIIEEIKKNPKAYDYIEVMACPGGCIGGGGQPIPSTNKIIAQRTKALYKIDGKMKIRKAHRNPVVRDFFENYIAKLPQKKQSAILHTSFSKEKKFE